MSNKAIVTSQTKVEVSVEAMGLPILALLCALVGRFSPSGIPVFTPISILAVLLTMREDDFVFLLAIATAINFCSVALNPELGALISSSGTAGTTLGFLALTGLLACFAIVSYRTYKVLR